MSSLLAQRFLDFILAAVNGKFAGALEHVQGGQQHGVHGAAIRQGFGFATGEGDAVRAHVLDKFGCHVCVLLLCHDDPAVPLHEADAADAVTLHEIDRHVADADDHAAQVGNQADGLIHVDQRADGLDPLLDLLHCVTSRPAACVVLFFMLQL